MRLFVVLALFIPTLAAGLETDNYLVWDRDLRDSTAHINRYFADNIRESLEGLSDASKYSCRQVTEFIGKKFESRLVHDNPLENWLFEVLSADEMFPPDIYYVDESIYREPYRFYIPWFGLAPNIQVNGIYFGTDKLSHFASTGMIYFKMFHRELRKKKSITAAEKVAINWGVKDEKTVHGYWASGVFSFADLEANYQGLRFYRKFCESDSPYLRKTDSRWRLAVDPDIREYVNPLWDETSEPPYRLPKNWDKVKEEIRNKYCERQNSPHVAARFNYYLKFPLSRSKQHLNELQAAGAVPRPQSFSRLCLNF